jgi:antitoxin FitA
MASLTIRNIDDSLKATLRMSAAANQRSMEEEARQILKRFLLQKKCAEGIGTRIAKRFSEAGGIELPPVSPAILGEGLKFVPKSQSNTIQSRAS